VSYTGIVLNRDKKYEGKPSVDNHSFACTITESICTAPCFRRSLINDSDLNLIAANEFKNLAL